MSDNILVIQGPEEKRKAIRYEVDGDLPVLGEGNFGAVRKAVMIDEATGESRDVAIKFLFSDLSAQGVERSRREAGIRIKNDNLVEMIDFVQIVAVDANGNKSVRNHVVSELLQGVMLLSLMKDGIVTDREGNEIPRAKNLLELYQTDPVRFACEVTSEVLLGVKALHDNGYIHRDIDPSNIMITMDGRIKLIDLGIAKDISVKAQTNSSHLTNTGDFVGKHAYAAPELILGDVDSQNTSTDLYAVGIVLYQLATGKLPFKGTIHEITQQHLTTPVPVEIVPNSDLRAIIKKATAKEQPNRYSSAEDFRQALTRVKLDGPEKTGTGIDKTALKKWGLIGGIGLAAVLVLLVLLKVLGVFGGKGNVDIPGGGDFSAAYYTVKDSLVTLTNGPESKRVYKYSGEVSAATKLPDGAGEAHFDAMESLGEPACDYRGKFKNGLFDDEGMAILTFDNGAAYAGSFSGGYYKEGKLTNSDRTRFEGTFNMGKPYTGTFYDANGNPDGTIVNGVESDSNVLPADAKESSAPATDNTTTPDATAPTPPAPTSTAPTSPAPVSEASASDPKPSDADAAKKKAEEAKKKAEELKKQKEEAAKKKEEEAKKKAEAEAAKKAKEEAAGPKVPYGKYSGPANGIGGEITVTRGYSLNLRNGSSVYLSPGDKIYNTRFLNGELKQGVWTHNGVSQMIMR